MIVYRVTCDAYENCTYFALKKDVKRVVDGPDWNIEKIVVNNREMLAKELNDAVGCG